MTFRCEGTLLASESEGFGRKRGTFMGLLIAFSYLFSLGLCSAFVCCGALLVLSRVRPLLDRQRVALWGVGQ